MAPMKRKAAGSMGGAMKKPAGVGAAVAKKCKVVGEAVLGAEGLPADVLKMLGTNLTDFLGVCKEERHPYQEKVIAMVGEVLKSVEASVEATIADAEAKVAESGTEKNSRLATEEAAAATLKEKVDASETASAAHAESVASLKAANDAEKAAEKELKSDDAALAAASKQLAKLQSAHEAYLPMKEAGSSAHPSGMATLEKVGEEFGLNNSLLTSLASALAKPPDARGSFDGVCLSQVEDELAKLIADATEKVTAAEGTKAAAAEKVSAAKAAVEAAAATNTAAAETESACKAAVKEATADAKAASKAVKMFAPEMKTVEAALGATKADLQALRDGAMAAYAELVELSNVPPPEPPAPVEEEAAPVAEAA